MMEHTKDHAPPAAFMCPITLDVMEDPVCAPDGRSYDEHTPRLPTGDVAAKIRKMRN